jgi:hypothetical protein
MGDFKSKLPDLKELGSMSSKMFKAISGGVSEIIADYKKKREPKPEEEITGEATPSAPPEQPKETTMADSTETKTEEKK